ALAICALPSILLGRALGWCARWQGDPGMTCLLPHRDGRRREIRIGEGTDGNRDVSGKTFALPVDRGTACRTEMKGQRVAALGRPRPRRRVARDGHLFAAEACLVADHCAGAALALQAVAHRDARWLALDRKMKLPAAAGGASACHGSTPCMPPALHCRAVTCKV